MVGALVGTLVENMATWQSLLNNEQQQPYFIDMVDKIAAERASGIEVFPQDKDIYQAMELTEFDNIKVVILGQDPYHGPEQAHGLAFSVQPGIKTPPSLVNIYKELATDINGFTIPKHGYLKSWAEQGVLLLNTVLTVQRGNAHSHAKLGWEIYTDKIIELINRHQQGVVFLLWGSHAQKKGAFIDTDKHCVLTSAHPSPLSAYRGFFGCKHFSKANEYLHSINKTEIDWQITDSQMLLL